MYRADERVQPIGELSALNFEDQDIAAQLRDLFSHYRAQEPDFAAAYDRLVHEIGFTSLNRLVFLRLAEERGYVVECVRKALDSEGFRIYQLIVEDQLGTPFETYRFFLHLIFDEMAVDLHFLFDRSLPQGLIFPSEPVLRKVLADLSAADLMPLCKEDETIGWVYQFFNDPEERKRMRDQSQAPRNSREMAVRNQFFTPRYVVEFLVDNTLGRIWIEMRQGKTGLGERCQYLFERKNETFLGPGEASTAAAPPIDATKEQIFDWPIDVPFRTEKDPRDLKILDPACGSGHFLLYSFDLLEAIYLEAWNEPSEPAPISVSTGKTLREDYASLSELAWAMPGLILAHNLFGVDIDPRAIQIAAVALWLRAQRAYQEAGLRNIADRPKITKMNFVVAEPMPGEADLKLEFLNDLRPRVVAQVAERVFQVMKLAGEAGVLLRAEQALAGTLSAARMQWEAEREVPEGLFPELASAGTKSLFDLSDINDDAFWEVAEQTIFDALSRFAVAAEASDPLRRRLFADDSARGFAFIDLCRTRFDVFLMNPPFGEPTILTKPILDTEYQDAKSDVLQAFVERGGELLQPAGVLGCISNRTPFFLVGSSDFRERVVLRLFRPMYFADLGYGIMDSAQVEAAAYVFRTLNSEERSELINSLAVIADNLANARDGAFRRVHWERLRSLKRIQANQELDWLTQSGFIQKHADDSIQVKSSWTRTRRPLSSITAIDGAKKPIVFISGLGAIDKNKALTNGLLGGDTLFFASEASLRKLPGTPFSYWTVDAIRDVFTHLPPLSNQALLTSGTGTLNDFRFLRCWWEVEREPHWFPYEKGGTVSSVYYDPHLSVGWARDGAEMKAWIVHKYGGGHWARNIRSTEHYLRRGLTWPRRTKGLSFRVMPSGCIFADKGPALFVAGDNTTHLLALCAILTSEAFGTLVDLQLAGAELIQSFEVGLVQSTPAPALDASAVQLLASHARTIWQQKYLLDSYNETSHAFSTPRHVDSFRGSRLPINVEELVQIESQKINDAVNLLYGWTSTAERSMSGFSIETAHASHAPGNEIEDEDEAVDTSHEGRKQFCELFSWLVGVAIGRWNLTPALSSTNITIPDPFDALPSTPPGMQNTDGFLSSPESGATSPRHMHSGGIWVDDPGDGVGEEHPSDLLRAVRKALALVYEESAYDVEKTLCNEFEIEDLREYLRKPSEFFAEHLKRYSKSRRRAPIYWPLSTASCSYTLWIYYPRLSQQTIYAAVETYVRPKLVTVERQRDRLEGQLRDNTLAPSKDRDRLSKLRNFAQELVDLRDELLRIASMPYKPNMNDGVAINAAPMRGLFRHKPWVKELEEVWKKLEKGDYDWSHMAFTLWPDRVRPKCVKDRSLAIAHDLESICETPDPTKDSEKKRKRDNSKAILLGEEYFD